MSFSRKTWADRISEYPSRRTLTKADSTTEVVTVARNEGTVTTEGDIFNATTMNDLEGRISNGFSNAVPSGLICMWSGAANAIPEGWALCNGENNTPNLCDRFIIGAGDTYNVGGTGGTLSTGAASGNTGSTSLSTSQIPSHSHSISLSSQLNGISSATGGAGGNGSYFGITSLQQISMSGTSGSAGSGSAHSHSLNSHTHTVTPPYYALCFIMRL